MSVRAIEAEVSIKSGIEAECTIGREVIVEVHDDINLETLTATANGSYRPESGIDGWDRVTVAVPERQPVTEPLSVTANGQYEPSEGVDGFSDVSVQVPERIPVTESLSVTENGTYEPTEGVDGYDRVTVAVPPTIPDIEPLTVTENGTYTASGDGYNPVTVNVPAPVPSGTKRIEITENGTKIEDVAWYANAEIIINVITALGMQLDWADVQEITIGENSVKNGIEMQSYLSSYAYTLLILKDTITVNNQLVFATSNNRGTSINNAFRVRNNSIGAAGITTSYAYKLVEGSVYYAITQKASQQVN